MERLQAFIGYSYDDEDKEVVDRFLNYFDSLKEIISFDWDHAKKAESKTLSDKVKQKMEGKNVFIGIFTRKSFEVEKEKLKKHFFTKKKYASELDLRWGTSNWIIQESGYAIAKEMDLLFLVEQGIKTLVGLQGDIEYINFTRNNPEKCFRQIIEMLGSLLKKETRGMPSEKRTALKREEDIHKDAELLEKKEEEPEIETSVNVWSKNFNSLYKAIVTEKDYKKAEDKLGRIKAESTNENEFDDIYWRTISYRLKIKAGDRNALNELKEFAKRNPDESVPLFYIADIYRNIKKYLEAAHKYLEASERKTETIEKLRLIGEAADCYAEDKDYVQSYKVLLKQFENNSLGTSEYHYLFKTLSQIAKKEDNSDLFEAFGEKALDCDPFDSGTRFALAYHYGETDKNPLALGHYNFLLDFDENGTNLNNIAVAYDELGMKWKSISYYQRAIYNHNETLSMANIAKRYVNEGFIEPANEILSKARKVEGYHKNIDSGLLRIKQKKDEENKKEEATLKDTVQENKFMAKFAKAYAMPFEVNIDGEWESKHGVLSIKVEGEKITGQGERTKPDFGNLLRKRVYGLGIYPKDKDTIKEIVILNGTITNRGIIYEIIVKTESTLSLLTNKEEILKGLMIASEDNLKLEVKERHKDKTEVTFYEMNKI